MRLPSDLGGNPKPAGPYACATNAPSGNTSQPVMPFSALGFLVRLVLKGVVVTAAAGIAAASRPARTIPDAVSNVRLAPRRRDREPTTSNSPPERCNPGGPRGVDSDCERSPGVGQASLPYLNEAGPVGLVRAGRRRGKVPPRRGRVPPQRERR